jgi:hypothetical protein
LKDDHFTKLIYAYVSKPINMTEPEFPYTSYEDRERYLAEFDGALDRFIAQWDHEHGLKADIVYEILLNLVMIYKDMTEKRCGKRILDDINNKTYKSVMYIDALIAGRLKT